MRYTAGFSIFYATISLILVNLINRVIKNSDFKVGLIEWYNQTIVGLQKVRLIWWELELQLRLQA